MSVKIRKKLFRARERMRVPYFMSELLPFDIVREGFACQKCVSLSY